VLSDDVRQLYERVVGWVLLAASLRTAEAAPLMPKLAAPTIYEREPADWATLTSASEETRREARFRMLTVEFGGAEMVALPAVAYVLAHVARDGKSPEVWLDGVFASHNPRLNGCTGMRARAEAARWRGDGATAARWDGLAETLERQFSSPKKALLARLARLD
jgi:hypothetical protein